MKRTLSFISIIIWMLSAFITTAFAEDVEITVVPDKTSYEANETIVLDIIIKNNTSMIMKNLRISNIVPEGMDYAVASPSSIIQEVLPNETIHCAVRLSESNMIVPSTGDSAKPMLWLFLTGISAFVLLIVIKYRIAVQNTSK